MPTSLHELAQDVAPGAAVIPAGRQVGNWEFYNPRLELYAETFPEPQVAHANHVRNTTPANDRWMHWYWRLVSTESLAGAHGYGGWGIVHRIRPDVVHDEGLGFKVHFCHRANFENYLLMVQHSGRVAIWKEDRTVQGGFGRVIGHAPYDFEVGRQFEWYVEVDGRGGVMVRVDDVEVAVQDDDPITSGTVGYRLDRVDASWGADGFDL